jgi:hypothetical protein
MDSETYLGDAGLATDSLDDDYDTTWVDDGTLPPGRYLDRELSWLAFNTRVLELAEDPELPLLERANFLAIFASNLDEFFMVRIAGLKRRILTGLAVPTNVGTAPTEVLAVIQARAPGAPRGRIPRPRQARPGQRRHPHRNLGRPRTGRPRIARRDLRQPDLSRAHASRG